MIIAVQRNVTKFLKSLPFLTACIWENMLNFSLKTVHF